MKKLLTILTTAILLPASAFAGKKKDRADNPAPQQTDGTDWLNAPTPDGSPTLKQTSDWLAMTFADYGSYSYMGTWYVSGVSIDNSCNFHYTTTQTWGDDRKSVQILDHTVPLGAMTDIQPHSDVNDRVIGIEYHTGNVPLIHFASHGRGDYKKPQEYVSYADTLVPFAGDPPIRPGIEVHSYIEMVPRVISALQHAVSLCKSTYKPPVQKKQPF
jgi:hypothetical protein